MFAAITIVTFLFSYVKTLDVEQLQSLIDQNNKAAALIQCQLDQVIKENDTFYDMNLSLHWEVWVQNQQNLLRRFIYLTDFTFGEEQLVCPAAIPSGLAPTSVHTLYPSDIDVVAELGDLQPNRWRRNCKQFKCLFEFGDKFQDFELDDSELDDQITLGNIIKQFNRNAVSFSITSQVSDGSKSASNSGDLSNQAWALVKKLQEQNSDEKWKLVTIFVGINEASCACMAPAMDLATDQSQNIQRTLTVLRDNLPRTYVNLVNVAKTGFWKTFWDRNPFCELWLGKCYTSTAAEKSLARLDQQLLEIIELPEYQTDNFTVNMQKLFTQSDTELPEMPLLNLDCMHLNRASQSWFSAALWNNMLRGTDAKRPFDGTKQSLLCPSRDCPYLSTLLNDDQCKSYLDERFGTQPMAMAYTDSSNVVGTHRYGQIYFLFAYVCIVFVLKCY